jgi:hypothetical protein
MANKKIHYITPIGTFNYPWLDTPSKWDASARDGKGGSVRADKKDLNASYSVKMCFTKDEFSDSDFKKQIDELWALTNKDYQGKFDEVKNPYWTDDDGNYCLTARRQAAFLKDEKVQSMRPKLEDCTGRDITKYVEEEGISVASESIGRLDLTTYVPVPKKKDGVATLRMNFDLVKVQFKKLVRYEPDKPMDAIAGGDPIGEDDGLPF